MKWVYKNLAKRNRKDEYHFGRKENDILVKGNGILS
jgi:hypothetical protein